MALRQDLAASLVMEDRDRLASALIGKLTGICKGFSMPDDANQAMLHICDALADYRRECAKSFDAESGPFATTFAVYADEARDQAADMENARKRWEVANVPALLRSVEYLIGHLIAATRGECRERIYTAGRAISRAHRLSATGKATAAEERELDALCNGFEEGGEAKNLPAQIR